MVTEGLALVHGIVVVVVVVEEVVGLVVVVVVVVLQLVPVCQPSEQQTYVVLPTDTV